MKLHHILLPTDLSSESDRAYEPVLSLAKANGARVTLLHVVPDLVVAPHGAPFAPPVHSPDSEEHLAAARKDLAALTERLGGDVPLEFAALTGENTARAIARFAEENGVDMIALSTHGRSGFRRMVLGSVAEAVLHHAHVPVLCFPRPE